MESSSKNVPNRTKIVQGNKKCARTQKCASVAHYGIELSCLPCMALCGFFVALCGLVWPYVASYGFVDFHRHNMAGIV